MKIVNGYTVEPNANLSEANLEEANLSRANLEEANLIDADLSRANLSRANLVGATLIEADLSKANLSEANLSRAYLVGANLSGANLSGANLIGANLSDANLIGATVPVAAFDCRGFALNVRHVDGRLQFIAGCRRFTLEQALDHWGSPDYANPERGRQYCAWVKAADELFYAGALLIKPPADE